MVNSSPQKKQISSDTVAKFLERNGWLRSVAGDHDFELAAKGIAMAVNESRGLLLVGNPGVGKTFLLRILKNLYHSESWFSCSSRFDLIALQDVDKNLLNRFVFVDDVGVEDVQLINFQKIDCFKKFVQWYYDMGATGRLFISTNLDGKALGDKYDGRILDRLMEMCVVIKFSGKSKREYKVLS